MRKIYLLLSVIILAGSVFFFSCNENTIDVEAFGSIKGTIKASEDNSPLQGVSLTTSPGTTAVTTDSEGKFDFGSVASADYTLAAKKEGYKGENIQISVGKDQVVNVDVILQLAETANSAPNTPTYLSPDNGLKEQPIELELMWQASDPDEGDTLRYDVVLFEGDDLEGEKVVENSYDTTFLLSGLRYGTAYRWKVIARDKSDEETLGGVWGFKTQDYPNNRYFFVRKIDGNQEIYSTDLSELNTIRVTTDPNQQLQPRISPNHELVAFTSNEDGDFHIYTMKKDGTEKFKVTRDIPVAGYYNNGIGYSWSPDGAYLIYSNYNTLFRIRNDGTDLTPIASAPINRHFRECHWSKYTNKIVVLTVGAKPYDNEIYLMDADGSNMTLLVDNLPGTIGSPNFSVDGKKVIFTHDLSELEGDDGRQLDAHVFSIDLDGSNMTDLSEDKVDGTNDLQPRFSPDGAKIIFVNTSNDGIGDKNIWVMDVDGNNRDTLILNGQMPDWR